MTDFAVRLLEESEMRASSDLFFATLHYPPLSNEKWEYATGLYVPGRVWGAFADQTLIGTALFWESSLAVPGGAELPTAAVTCVGVRADHTRRGVLTELMRTQLTTAVEAGQVAAALHASEPVIYERFGYGQSTIARTARVRRRQAALRPEVPKSGEVRLLDGEQALSVLPATYERLYGHRPGMIRRIPAWWRYMYEARVRTKEHMQVAVHTGPDGYDGFVSYEPQEHPTQNSPWPERWLRVSDFHAVNQAVANDLWRFLLGVDLVDEVLVWARPTDEPLEAMLVDQRAVQAEFDDDLWLRLIDVPAALAARSYGQAEPVVLEVRDRYLPANSGRYLISPQGTERTTGPADLAMDVETLAAIYLGATRASTLAGIGRIQVTEPAALPRADRLFATDVAACCGTMF